MKIGGVTKSSSFIWTLVVNNNMENGKGNPTTTTPRFDVRTDMGRENDCPMTLECITNPGLTADGFVYQMGYIMNWLRDNTTSPLTNLNLTHRRILRIASMKDIFQAFLLECKDHRKTDYTHAEDDTRARCEADGNVKERGPPCGHMLAHRCGDWEGAGH